MGLSVSAPGVFGCVSDMMCVLVYELLVVSCVTGGREV